MRRADVGYGQGGYKLYVVEVPLRVVVMQNLLEAFFAALCTCHIHLFCEPPEWMWHVGWSKTHPGDPDYHADMPNWLRHSLGRGLHQVWQRGLSYGYHKEKRVAEIPLTLEMVKASFPDNRIEFLEEGNERLDTSEPEPITEEPGKDAMRVPRRRYRLFRWRGRVML